MFFQRVQRSSYAPERIKQVMRGDTQRLPDGPEHLRIQMAVGRLSSMIERDRMRREFAGLERYMDRLPRILYLYSRGYSVNDIADHLPGLPTHFGVERTIDIAAHLVAEELASR